MQKWVSSLMILICTHNVLESQLCIDGRFTEAGYFSNDEITFTTNVSYGLADHWYYGIPAPLLNTFNIAYPSFAVDPLEKRPLVILAHGGGFWGGEKENLDYIIQQFAQKGYVAVSTNYRKGWDAYGDPENCDGDGASMYQAIYKAMQDVQASVRYLVANADAYGIDTSWIFLGGQSAGVYAMMNSIYASQDDWNTLFPEHAALLGNLDDATNEIVAEYTVKGFLNFWGGILDKDFITANNALPTINFFGTEDGVVPPFEGNFQGCDDYAYVYGSESIAQKLNDLGICNVMHKRVGYGHDTYEDDYVVGNSACYMKSIFCNDCSTYEVNFQLGACNDLVANNVFETSKQTLKVFPNPANDYVVIESINPLQTSDILKVYNSTGEEIHVNYTLSNSSLILQTEQLVTGVYFFSINKDDIKSSGSFIINN